MSERKVIIRRLATGVPGLDDVLGGGLPEYSFNLIAGPPGSGKTTLAHQMMFTLATAQQNALYFTALGEPPAKMLRYQQQFTFFDIQQISSTIRFISLADELGGGDLAKVLARITLEVEAYHPGFIFVDSFRSVVIASEAGTDSPLGLQQFVQQLGVLLSSCQATTFLVGEYLAENEPGPVSTIADGLFWLRQSVQRNSVVRKMEVAKMRGQATEPGLHTFRIGASGIELFSPPKPAPARDQHYGPLKRITSGIAELDTMLGGGLPSGYSLLVAGPSGSGKSMLAAAFLVEGARLGHTGVIVAFEQRPNRSRGPEITALIENGQLGVIDTTAPGISVDEIASLLLAEVARLDAKRVVIDSLSGFELVLAPTFRADFRESLARLVSAITGYGVTVLMTSELEDRYEELRFSPYGTAFLTDAIIVQRYIELESHLHRVMAVVKVRASTHSSELRRYTIDDAGLRLGATLGNYEGLLGGRPSRIRGGPNN